MFSYQQNFFTPTKEVTREQFWALVGAPLTKELIDAVRAAKARGDDAEAARLKKRLPAFIFQATFDVTRSKSGAEGRWRKQAATRLNGLCVLDIDHVEDPRQLFMNWGLTTTKTTKTTVAASSDLKKLSKVVPVVVEKESELSSRILLVYVTPSGRGLKVVFKADPGAGCRGRPGVQGRLAHVVYLHPRRHLIH